MGDSFETSMVIESVHFLMSRTTATASTVVITGLRTRVCFPFESLSVIY